MKIIGEDGSALRFQIGSPAWGAAPRAAARLMVRRMSITPLQRAQLHFACAREWRARTGKEDRGRDRPVRWLHVADSVCNTSPTILITNKRETMKHDSTTVFGIARYG